MAVVGLSSHLLPSLNVADISTNRLNKINFLVDTILTSDNALDIMEQRV